MAQTETNNLFTTLDASADILRATMDANEYKDYLLGLIFYKYLSDKMLVYVTDQLEQPTTDLKAAQEIYSKYFNDPDYQEDLIENIKTEFSYVIEPNKTYTNFINLINTNKFQLEDLAQGFRDIEQANEIFENMFEDIDLYSKKLGTTAQKQNRMIAEVMQKLDAVDVVGHDGDTLGDAYEYLIGQFASDSGKKAGEFYTPQPVSRLMMQIVIHGKEDKKGFTVYDPTMGSGSLLLNAKHYSNEPGTINYYGQEVVASTFNLARMNMFLHGVDAANQHLSYGDTLDEDWPVEEPTNFDAVVMNPPYSQKWSAEKGFLDDPRFASYGVLAPKSKADFAFLLHGYYHLKTDGVMAIVLPHGVLFRGAAEGKIRKALLENGSIDTVIGLPANLFFNTSIPTTIIILKKDRDNRDVYFIDASKEFEKNKNQNVLRSEDTAKILDAYLNKKDIDKFAHLATFDEIQENDFNLNIPRYVDTFEEEEPISLKEVAAEMKDIDKEIGENEKKLAAMIDDLYATTPEAEEELKAFMQMFGGVN